MVRHCLAIVHLARIYGQALLGYRTPRIYGQALLGYRTPSKDIWSGIAWLSYT